MVGTIPLKNYRKNILKTKVEIEKYYSEIKSEVKELQKAKDKAIEEDRPRSEKAIRELGLSEKFVEQNYKSSFRINKVEQLTIGSST